MSSLIKPCAGLPDLASEAVLLAVLSFFERARESLVKLLCGCTLGVDELRRKGVSVLEFTLVAQYDGLRGPRGKGLPGMSSNIPRE